MSRYDAVCFDRFGCDIWLILTFMTLTVLSIKSNVFVLPKRWEVDDGTHAGGGKCNDCAYNVEEVFGVKHMEMVRFWRKWQAFGSPVKVDRGNSEFW